MNRPIHFLQALGVSLPRRTSSAFRTSTFECRWRALPGFKLSPQLAFRAVNEFLVERRPATVAPGAYEYA